MVTVAPICCWARLHVQNPLYCSLPSSIDTGRFQCPLPLSTAPLGTAVHPVYRAGCSESVESPEQDDSASVTSAGMARGALRGAGRAGILIDCAGGNSVEEDDGRSGGGGSGVSDEPGCCGLLISPLNPAEGACRGGVDGSNSCDGSCRARLP